MAAARSCGTREGDPRHQPHHVVRVAVVIVTSSGARVRREGPRRAHRCRRCDRGQRRGRPLRPRVSMLGTVPGGLPHFGFPEGMTLERCRGLVPTALSISCSSSPRARPRRVRMPPSTTSGSARTPTSSVSGSPGGRRHLGHVRGERQPDQDADGRQRRRPSQLAQITTGAITVIVLLFLTKPLSTCPTPCWRPWCS